FFLFVGVHVSLYSLSAGSPCWRAVRRTVYPRSAHTCFSQDVRLPLPPRHQQSQDGSPSTSRRAHTHNPSGRPSRTRRVASTVSQLAYTRGGEHTTTAPCSGARL